MDDLKKHISEDTDGMLTYDYIVNNIENCEALMPNMDLLIDNLFRADVSGQFLASSARFLSAVNKEMFHTHIGRLVVGAIEKDREHRYIGSLLEAIWGSDYAERAEELNLTDDNFRRIYKRIYPDAVM